MSMQYPGTDVVLVGTEACPSLDHDRSVKVFPRGRELKGRLFLTPHLSFLFALFNSLKEMRLSHLVFKTFFLGSKLKLT